MLFFSILAVLVFGPKKLPKIACQIGKALAQSKRASNEFQRELEEQIRNLEREENLYGPSFISRRYV
jgi:Sec-independent protein translocase protein TatA